MNRVTGIVLWCVFAGVQVAQAQDLPLLERGQHLGVHRGFNADTPASVQRVLERKLEEARDAGMDVSVVTGEWPELEPRRGEYDLTDLTAALAAARREGTQPLLLLNVIDADDVMLPSYLDPADEIRSLSQVQIDQPRIIRRFRRLLDKVVPVLLEHRGFAIIIATEPDNHLGENPERTPQVVNLLRAVRAHVRTLNPDLRVAMTLSNRDDRPAGIGELVRESDFASYNLYCTDDSDGSVARLRTRLEMRMAEAGAKELLIQELGCPSGRATDPARERAMLERQRRWFESFFSLMRLQPRIRAAFVFQLVDWSDQTLQTYMNFLRPTFLAETGGDEAATRHILDTLAASLGTIGLLKADGSEKPAWRAFLEGIRSLP